MNTFFKPSIARLTAGLAQIISNLEAHALAEAKRANQLADKAEQLRRQADEAFAESTKADAIAVRIGKLLA